MQAICHTTNRLKPVPDRFGFGAHRVGFDPKLAADSDASKTMRVLPVVLIAFDVNMANFSELLSDSVWTARGHVAHKKKENLIFRLKSRSQESQG